jgi:hypothetical protein
MGDIPLDLNQSPTNINSNFNVSLDGRWTPNGHLTVEFGVRWDNALASAVASITHPKRRDDDAFNSAFDKYSRPVLPPDLV